MNIVFDNGVLYCDDNLNVFSNINENSIDLIYLDPPFNKNKTFTGTAGSFEDAINKNDIKDEWIINIERSCNNLFHFLIWMREKPITPHAITLPTWQYD